MAYLPGFTRLSLEFCGKFVAKWPTELSGVQRALLRGWSALLSPTPLVKGFRNCHNPQYFEPIAMARKVIRRVRLSERLVNDPIVRGIASAPFRKDACTVERNEVDKEKGC